MSSSTAISRRTLLGGLAAAVVTPAAAKPAGAIMKLDAVPAWCGPGLYEIAGPGGSRVVFVELAPARPGRGAWFTGAESLADRADGGTWSMSAEALAFQDIRWLGEITE